MTRDVAAWVGMWVAAIILCRRYAESRRARSAAAWRRLFGGRG